MVHELRQLAATKELVNGPSNWLSVDDIVQHHRLGILQGHALLDRPLHPNQSNPELGLQQFSNTANPTITKVVNVINESTGVAFTKQQQILHRFHDVPASQDDLIERLFYSQFLIDFESTNLRQAVAVFTKEEVLQHILRCIQSRRISWLHLLVEFDQ